MYIGMSKNIGGGFRIGFGTKIGGRKTVPTSKELRTSEFNAFMQKVQNELDSALITYVKANGHDFDALENEQVDLDVLFKDSDDYDEFRNIVTNVKNCDRKSFVCWR